MGTCFCRSHEVTDDLVPAYDAPGPIEMLGLHELEVSQRGQEATSTPFSDRDDASVRISKSKFVGNVEGKLLNHYSLDEVLGQGSYGTVYRAIHYLTGSSRAVKVLLSEKIRGDIMNEAEILKSLDHPNILKIHEVIEDSRSVNIVTELCTGGNLYERVVQRGLISENTSAHYIRQILSSLIYCHKAGIVHRDLKPENILFESAREDSLLKVIDFGISTHFSRENPLKNSIGTIYYMAPEVITGEYGEKCDIWSCGVILYILLVGKPPFYGATKQETLQRIKKGVFTFQDPLWRPISKGAKSLIRQMLTKDPALRVSAEQAYESPWIQQRATWLVADNCLSQQVLCELAAFSGIWKIRQASLHYIVSQLDAAKEIKGLREVFISLDSDGDGRLSLAELETGFTRLKLGAKYDIASILENCDANMNGVVDYTEFLAATINWKKALSQEWIELAFSAYDKDHNGKIDLEEIRSFIGDDSVESGIWESMFREADINADGFIDLEEFKSIMLSN